jgi:hypothetical protein
LLRIERGLAAVSRAGVAIAEPRRADRRRAIAAIARSRARLCTCARTRARVSSHTRACTCARTRIDASPCVRVAAGIGRAGLRVVAVFRQTASGQAEGHEPQPMRTATGRSPAALDFAQRRHSKPKMYHGRASLQLCTPRTHISRMVRACAETPREYGTRREMRTRRARVNSSQQRLEISWLLRTTAVRRSSHVPTGPHDPIEHPYRLHAAEGADGCSSHRPSAGRRTRPRFNGEGLTASSQVISAHFP